MYFLRCKNESAFIAPYLGSTTSTFCNYKKRKKVILFLFGPRLSGHWYPKWKVIILFLFGPRLSSHWHPKWKVIILFLFGPRLSSHWHPKKWRKRLLLFLLFDAFIHDYEFFCCGQRGKTTAPATAHSAKIIENIASV